MKCIAAFLLVGLAAGSASDANPIDMVVTLLQGVQQEIEKDGKAEQASYDKYACWVEDTLQRKATDIGNAKDTISDLNDQIKKLGAEIASHGAEIAQLNKDIAQNKEANKDATALRDKEYKEYAADRTELEQCIGALEMAIKVLTGAGTKAAGFMQQYREAQLMSVAVGVRKVMERASGHLRLSDGDASVVMHFVEQPQDFAKHTLIAVQTAQNPFGDYAPKSDQIQGILQGMYDAFTADLEKSNSGEAEAEKSYRELMATKKQELDTLEASLEKQEMDSAEKTKAKSEGEQLREDTTDQLAADEKFFDETKQAAQDKATEWSVRTRLRVEELAGIQGAVEILKSGDATFEEAHKGKVFLQVGSVSKHSQSHQSALGTLKQLAKKYQSSNLRRMVTLMKNGGHFDEIMGRIDEMMAILRKEEQEDIAHRDRCENGENANANSIDDLNADIANADKKIKRMNTEDGQKSDQVDKIVEKMDATKANMAEMLKNRNKEHDDFKRAVQMDDEAIHLITMATARLTKYYADNKIALALVEAPDDKPPETKFSNKDSHSEESGGIVAILNMIKEDLQKEMKEARSDEAKAEADFQKQTGALQASLDAQTETKVSLEKERAHLQDKISATEDHRDERKADLNSQGDMKKALATDCDWVAKHFDKRRDARKSEMQGLVEAKNFLAGVDAGDPVLAPR